MSCSPRSPTSPLSCACRTCSWRPSSRNSSFSSQICNGSGDTGTRKLVARSSACRAQIVAAAQKQNGLAQEGRPAPVGTFARHLDIPVATGLVRQMGDDADRVSGALRNPRELRVRNGLELFVISQGSGHGCSFGSERLLIFRAVWRLHMVDRWVGMYVAN